MCWIQISIAFSIVWATIPPVTFPQNWFRTLNMAFCQIAKWRQTVPAKWRQTVPANIRCQPTFDGE